MNKHSAQAQAQAMIAAGLRDRLTLRLLRESGEARVEAMGFHTQQARRRCLARQLGPRVHYLLSRVWQKAGAGERSTQPPLADLCRTAHSPFIQ